MKFSEKDIRIFRNISLVSGVFTLLVALLMLISLIQLKTIDPLDNPSIRAVKEQFDSDPDNRDKAEQVRAMDLMARRAYFSSRWQVETGSYLLLAGALIFVVFQRFIAGNEKPARALYPDKPDIMKEKQKSQRYLFISASVVTLLAVVSSFVLRSDLPAPGRSRSTPDGSASSGVVSEIRQPDGVNYPFFRGEGSRGIAGGSDYPVDWDGVEGRNIKWKTAVPRHGQSSPVIWGDKLFLTGAEGSFFDVYCFDKNNGDILWTGAASDFPGASSEVPESDAEAGMAVPTAAVNEEVVCAIFGNGNLVCYDHQGNLKWGKNIGVPQSSYGYSASLVMYNNLVFVQYDSQEAIKLLAFEISSGELKWETPRSGRPVNSSPVLAIFDRQPQILINGNPNVSSYDPVSGKELWSLPGVSGDVAPSLAVNSSLVFAVTDYYNLIALKPGKNGSTLWEDNSFTPDVSSPVATDEFVFLSTGNGDVACYSSEKGDTLWSHYFQDQFYASPIIADGNVYCLDRSGVMHIVKAKAEFQLVGQPSLGERTDCTPAFSESKIYIRSKNNLYCISGN